jgi:hypothetical protein
VPLVDLVIEKLKSHKSLGIYKIPAYLNKARSRTFPYEIHKPITSIWNKEKLPEERKKSIFVPICKKGVTTDCV